MKTLEFIYKDTEIHFSVNPLNKNIMVNATEMAKLFGKRTKDYLANKNTKAFIKELERTPISVRSESGKNLIVDNRGHMGIYFDRRLALKLAAWLDVKFEVWIFSTIEEITFGHYDKHLRATSLLEQEKVNLESLIKEVGKTQNELAIKVVESYRRIEEFKTMKSTAMKNQTALVRKNLFE